MEGNKIAIKIVTSVPPKTDILFRGSKEYRHECSTVCVCVAGWKGGQRHEMTINQINIPQNVSLPILSIYLNKMKANDKVQ